MNDSLLGLVGNTNYESDEFLSSTAYLFSQHNENLANGLYDTPTDLSINIDPVPSSNILPETNITPIDPGETIGQALDFGSFDGDGALSHTEVVGSGDPVDLYQFSISQNNEFNFVLEGLSADADLHLVDSNGAILVASDNLDTSVEILTASLPAGTYYLGVAFYDGLDTSYNLHAIGGENALSIAEINTFVDPALTTDFALI